jgi:hypothetical protein
MKKELDYKRKHPSHEFCLDAYTINGELYLRLEDMREDQHIIMTLNTKEIWWMFEHLHTIYNKVIGDF